MSCDASLYAVHIIRRKGGRINEINFNTFCRKQNYMCFHNAFRMCRLKMTYKIFESFLILEWYWSDIRNNGPKNGAYIFK